MCIKWKFLPSSESTGDTIDDLQCQNSSWVVRSRDKNLFDTRYKDDWLYTSKYSELLLYRASSLCTVKRLHIECRTSLTTLVFTVNCFYTESLINITIRIYKVNGGFTECSTYLTILLYTVSRLYNECPMSHTTLSNAYTESL